MIDCNPAARRLYIWNLHIDIGNDSLMQNQQPVSIPIGDKETMHSRVKSYSLVAIQFVCLILIAWSGTLLARHPLLLIVEFMGLGLGIWAIWSMRLFNFNVTPNVKVEGYMVERGPYQFIRHPMYSSLLIICTVLVIDQFTWLRMLILLILAADLIVKLHYEENLLASHYSQYADYMTRTKRLIPFVW